jgi:hypothetical protein
MRIQGGELLQLGISVSATTVATVPRVSAWGSEIRFALGEPVSL